MATRYDRRAFMAYFSSIGLGTTLLPGVLWAQIQRAGQVQQPEITKEDVAGAEEIAGLSFTDEERASIARGLRGVRSAIEELHKVPLDMSVFPAYVFEPVPPGKKLPAKTQHATVRSRVPLMARPGAVEELAYAPVTQLSTLLRTRAVTSLELTDMYLSRLKRYDSQLHFVINLTESRARAQARQMDREIAQGHYRGPLHGIPWGAKDLLAVKGYPTTWGAGLYKDQTFDYDATVVQRLDAAGAVLIAKLTLGALAQGDVWYGERTRNPWDPSTGSSGSSAGPASATSAGCVAFSIGSETNGSITSPSRTCGVTGFRPSFGRVPRTGAMALSWTTDKLGPICRSAEDCALVFAAIQGPDGLDYSVKQYPFNWNARVRLSSLRIGYFRTSGDRDLFQRRDAYGNMVEDRQSLDMLDALRHHGARIVEVPEPTPSYSFLDSLILDAECGAAFERDTLNGRIKELEPYSTWPNTFRTAQFIPGVDYVNANRARTLLMQQWWDLFEHYDVILSPAENTSVTNVVGTPSIVVPTGWAVPAPPRRRPGAPGTTPTPASGAAAAAATAGRSDAGRSDTGRAGSEVTRPGGVKPLLGATPPRLPLPTSMYIMGPIFRDEHILNVAHAFQEVTDFHLKHPPQFP
jgi:Asp-tRNA(Asn)/Glu-tRNA(Gln) amidotransferase A subunit family amidase